MEDFIITTERLTIRKIRTEDIPSLVKYANNPKIAQSVSNIPYPYSEFDAVVRIKYVHQGLKENIGYLFGIIFQETGELIGEMSLHLQTSPVIAQLGYWIGGPFWNKGIATEATGAILKFGFRQLNLGLIYAEPCIENEASKKVLLKSGMTLKEFSGSVAQFQLTKHAYENLMERPDPV